MDDKAMMQLLIQLKAKKAGLSEDAVNGMLGIQTPLSVTDQAQLTGAELSNFQKTLNIQQDQAKAPVDLQNALLEQQSKQQNMLQEEEKATKTKKGEEAIYKLLKAGKIDLTPEFIGKHPLLAEKYIGEVKNAQVKTTDAKTGIEKQKITGLSTAGLRNLKKVESLYNKDNSILAKQMIPGKFFSREFDAALYDAVDSLMKLRTGATSNENEIQGYLKRIAPNFGDSPQVVKSKIEQIRRDLEDAGGVQSKSSGGNDDPLGIL